MLKGSIFLSQESPDDLLSANNQSFLSMNGCSLWQKVGRTIENCSQLANACLKTSGNGRLQLSHIKGHKGKETDTNGNSIKVSNATPTL